MLTKLKLFQEPLDILSSGILLATDCRFMNCWRARARARLSLGVRRRYAHLETDMNDSLQSSSENPPAGPTRKRTVFQLLSLFMIGNFLWRAFKPGYEWPMRFEQVITIAFDLLCLASLIGLKIQISRVMPSSQSTWRKGNVLFWIALVAGLGVLAIRLHGDASWWTGHFFEGELRPR